MALIDVVAATSGKKIEWRKHDDGNGYLAHVGDSFRLDCRDGQYMLRENGIVIDEAADSESDLLNAIEGNITTLKTNRYKAFQAVISMADQKPDLVDVKE
jgi:hypothetical protein